MNQILTNEIVPIWTERVLTCSFNERVEAVLERLEKRAPELDVLNYVYVVDDDKKLKGVLSVREAMIGVKSRLVEEVATKKDLVTAHSHTHPETIAFLALKNKIQSVPIIDAQNHLIGAVKPRTIQEIIYREAHEDLLHLAGISHNKAAFDNILEISYWEAFIHRIPWLVLGLMGGLITAKVIEGFDTTLSQNLLLAAFIPLIVYMSDAVGTQMEAFVIRDLAVDRDLNFFKYFFKQLMVVTGIGLVTAILAWGASWLWYKDFQMGMVLAVALFAAIVSSVFTGLVIPFLFGKLNMDPANASGPIATILQDFMSVLIYFWVATLLL